MPTATKVNPKKAAEEAKKKADAAKEKLTNNTVTKTAADIFAKVKAKTGVSNEKVDAWQKSWLAMPKNRKKYEHLQDAPKVVGEELVAMSNDIIDFVQGEHGAQSQVFSKLKEEGSSFFKHPVDYIGAKVDKGVDSIMAAKKKAEEGAGKAKQKAGQAKAMAEKAKSTAKKVSKK